MILYQTDKSVVFTTKVDILFASFLVENTRGQIQIMRETLNVSTLIIAIFIKKTKYKVLLLKVSRYKCILLKSILVDHCMLKAV